MVLSKNATKQKGFAVERSDVYVYSIIYPINAYGYKKESDRSITQ